MSLLHRQDNVFKVATDADLQPSVTYTVTALSPGGVVLSITSSYITLYPGHGFTVNDRFIVGIDPTSYAVIDNVNGDILTVTTMTPPIAGDTLVNLGNDTGSTSPNYDGSDVVVYSTPDTTTTITESRVTTNSDGEYDYYHDGTGNLWELVRDTTGAPVAFVVGAYEIASPTLTDQVRYVNTYATVGTSGTSAVPWTGWETAFTSIPTNGATIIFADGYYTQNSAINLPVNLTGWLKITGNGGAIIKITATTPGLFGIASHSDYDTFKYIHIEGLQVDANSVAGDLSTVSPILIGPTTAISSRLNYANIIIRDIIMSSVSDTGKTTGIALYHTKVGGGDSATSASDILIENVWQDGGRNGIIITSDADTHTVARVTIRKHYHKKLAIPTVASPGAASAGAAIQLGSYAITQDTLVEDCYWQNNVDVGIEVDNPYRVTVRDCTAVDCYGIGFFATTFNTTNDINKNMIMFDNCRVLVSAGTEDTANCFFGFQAYGGVALPFGTAVFRDCYYENLDNYVHRPSNIDGYIRNITYDGLVVSMPNLIGENALYLNMFKWFNYYDGSVNRVRNCRVNWAMDSNSVNPLLVTWQFEIESGRLEVENCIVKGTITNPGASVYYAAIDATQSASFSQNITGFVRGFTVESVTGGLGSSFTVGVGFRQYLGASSNIIVEQCNLSGMPAGCSHFSMGAAADYPNVVFRDNLTSGTGYMIGPSVASTATMTLPVSGGFFIISGTADITSITASWNGRIVTLNFSGTKATNGLVDGSNLKLAGIFAYTPDDTITLYCDGTNWIEVARSVN